MKNSFFANSDKKLWIKFYKTLDTQEMDFLCMSDIFSYLISIERSQNIALGDILQV